jgi:hypothetical protein
MHTVFCRFKEKLSKKQNTAFRRDCESKLHPTSMYFAVKKVFSMYLRMTQDCLPFIGYTVHADEMYRLLTSVHSFSDKSTASA